VATVHHQPHVVDVPEGGLLHRILAEVQPQRWEITVFPAPDSARAHPDRDANDAAVAGIRDLGSTIRRRAAAILLELPKRRRERHLQRLRRQEHRGRRVGLLLLWRLGRIPLRRLCGRYAGGEQGQPRRARADEHQPAERRTLAKNVCHLISAPITWDFASSASSRSVDRALFLSWIAYSTTCVPSGSCTTPPSRHFLRNSSKICSTTTRDSSGLCVRSRRSTSRRCISSSSTSSFSMRRLRRQARSATSSCCSGVMFSKISLSSAATNVPVWRMRASSSSSSACIARAPWNAGALPKSVYQSARISTLNSTEITAATGS